MKKVIVIVTIIFIILMAIGTFYDYSLTDYFYNINSMFFKYSNIFGELPFSIVTTTGLSILFICYKNRLVKYLFLVVSVFTTTYFFYCLIKLFIESNEKYLISMILGILAVIVLYILIKNKTIKDTSTYKIIGYLLICYPIVVLVTIQIIKHIWGRPRYYSIIDGTNTFQNWYIISGFYLEDARHSFASSHTAVATTIIALTIFVKDKYKILVGILCGLVIVSTAFNRMHSGEHFLTDIAAGFYVSFIIYVILLNIYNKKIKNKD